VEFLFRCGINQFIIGPATGIEWSAEALRTYEEQMCLVADLYREMKEKGWPFRMTLFEKDLEGDEGICGECGAAGPGEDGSAFRFRANCTDARRF
jgi:hypothetical protein